MLTLGTPLSVLIVEDSASDAELMVRQLRQAGYEVTHERVDSAEAMRTALHSRTWDVALSDFAVPGFGATAALALLRESRLDIPFIVVSGLIGEETAAELMRNGAHDYLMKSNMARLAPAVERELAEARERVEHRAADAARRVSEERLRTLFAQAPMGIALIDSLTGQLEDVNPRFAEITGRASEELLNMDWMQITHPDDVQEDLDNMARMNAGEITGFRMNKRYVRPDGSLVWIGMTIAPLHVAERTRPLHLCMIQDITERLKAEESLRELSQFNAEIVKSAPMGVIVYGPDLRFQVWNPYMERLTRVPTSAVVGRLPLEVFPFLRESGVLGRVERVLGGAPAEINEFEMTPPDAGHSEWVREATSALHNTAGNIVGVIAMVTDITESKVAEAALRASESRFRSLFEMSRSVMMTIDPMDGSIVDANEAASKFYGWPVEELRRKAITDLNGLTTAEARERMDQVLHSQGTILHVSHRRADGSVRDVEVSASPIDVGERTLLYSIIHDITERTQAEESLRESQARYQGLVERMPAALYQYSVRRGGVFYSPRIEEYLGYPVGELLRNPRLWHDSIHPDDLPHVNSVIAAARDGSRGSLEYRIRDAVGKERWFREEFMASVKPDGEVLFDGLAQDITERKQMEEQLAKLSRALEQSPAMVLITDTTGRIEYANPRFSEVTGYSPAEVVGRNPRFLKSGDTSVDEYDKLWKTIVAGGVWRGQLHNKKKDGSLYWVRAVLSPVRGASGEILAFLGITEDITAQKALEEELRQAQKMESVGRLAGGIAHDFNNMLGVIMARTQLAQWELEPGHGVHEHLLEVADATRRSADLTAQLLTFARKQVIAPRVLDLNETIANMLKLLRRLVGEDVLVAWRPDPTLWRVEMDPGQMDQLMVNLSVNARHAMPRGGTLTITTSNVSIAVPPPGHRAGEFVRIDVQDTGHGMDADTREHVFEPFYTTKAAGEGTGLGLSTVYGIVQQNGGWITVDSAPEQGALFSIVLPRAVTAKTPTVAVTSPVISGLETVLLVEDEAAVLAADRLMLERLGFTVICASSGAEAIELVRRHEGKIDVLMTDVVMPGLNGKEVSEAVLALKPGIKVLFTSGYTSDVIGTAGAIPAGVHYLEKPYTIESLAAAICSAVDS